MKRKLLILISFIYTLSVSADNISQKWFFSSITSDNTNKSDFSSNDYLLIDSNNTFEYQIIIFRNLC